MAVTGSTGFIGNKLLAVLRCLSVDLIELKGNILNPDTFEHSFDVLIHLASALPGHFSDDADMAWDINTIGVDLAVNACERNRAVFVFPSTSGVYQGTSVLTQIDEKHPLNPRSPYARSKLRAEQLCQDAFNARGVNSSVLRIFNAYGAGQSSQSLIGYILECVNKNETVIVKNPTAIRDFVHVRDIVHALLLGATRPQTTPLNIGSGFGFSVTETIRALQMRLDNKIKVEFESSDEPSIVVANPTVASELLNWMPLISIDQGLDEVCGLIPPLS